MYIYIYVHIYLRMHIYIYMRMRISHTTTLGHVICKTAGPPAAFGLAIPIYSAFTGISMAFPCTCI